ncbi:hypothetical protein HM1_2217 [Heliomicrobium modesticaldum Ice1]|uniref:Uncharacterized protein n=1 Tax=Heliobacterium modesticaldum (strain ATCC 51547 / Ice1) TaxID=498761 RepID=B0TH98_HELMI|nr:hypothetical protein HM1_2217 [Heliomicrobium modesticaldum Ice1]
MRSPHLEKIGPSMARSIPPSADDAPIPAILHLGFTQYCLTVFAVPLTNPLFLTLQKTKKEG